MGGGGIRLTHVFVTVPYLLHPCREIHVMFILFFVGRGGGWGQRSYIEYMISGGGEGFHCLYDLWIYKSNCPTTNMNFWIYNGKNFISAQSLASSCMIQLVPRRCEKQKHFLLIQKLHVHVVAV